MEKSLGDTQLDLHDITTPAVLISENSYLSKLYAWLDKIINLWKTV
jgi:hypothetical protein